MDHSYAITLNDRGNVNFLYKHALRTPNRSIIAIGIPKALRARHSPPEQLLACRLQKI